MDKIFDILVDLAKQASDKNEVPCSAIIIDENQNVIAKGYNLVEGKKNPLMHAEMQVINQALQKIGTKVFPNFTLISSLEPCPMCATAITMARIKKCIFLVRDEKGGGILSNSKIPETQKNLFKTKFEYINAPQSAELLKLLQDFFKEKR